MGGMSKALMDFLVTQHGGLERAQSDYRKSAFKEAFRDRLSRDVSMREILEFVDTKSWTEWFGALSIVEFLNIFSQVNPPVSVATAMAMERKRALKILEESRTPTPDSNEKDRITRIMREFDTTPWLTKEDLKRITGIKSTPTIDKLTCAMCQRRLIKRCRGRKILFARFDEITPPPFYF